MTVATRYPRPVETASAVGALLLGLTAQTLVYRKSELDCALVLYALAIVLCIVALASRREEPAGQHLSISRLEAGLLVAMLGLAVFMRTFRLLEIPSGVFFDEAMNGLEAAQILEQNVHPLWSDELSGRPTLHLHILAVVFRFLGVNERAMRLVSAAAGTATVFALWLFARYLFDRRVALLAAFFLAVARWHVNYSRIAFEAILHPLLQLLAFYFLFRALDSRKLRHFFLSGLFLGLGLYTYISFRLVPLVIVVFLLYKVVSQRGFIRDYWTGVLLLFLTTVIIVSPLAVFASQNPERFTTRLQEVSLFAEIQREKSYQPLIKSVVGYLVMFNYQGDRNPVLNLSGEPALSFVPAMFFVLGLGWAVFRIRKGCYLFLLLMFVVSLLPGILTHSIEAPHGTRVIGAAPVVCLLAALAAVRLVESLVHLRNVWRVVAVVLLLTIVIEATLYMDYDAYFVRQATDVQSWRAFTPAATGVGELIKVWSDRYLIYVSPTYYYVFPDDTIARFAAYPHSEYRPLDPVGSIPLQEDPGRGVLYILEPRYTFLLETLQAFYPEGHLEEQFSPFGDQMFVSYRVEHDELAAAHGVTAQYYRGSTWSGEPEVVRHETGLAFDWQDTTPSLSAPFSALWEGSLFIPRHGEYTFSVSGGEAKRFELDGAPVPLDRGVPLARGLHSLSLWMTVDQVQEGVALLWEGPEIAQGIIPPSSLFIRRSPDHGLQGAYYKGKLWEGPPLLVEIDRAIFANAVLLEGIFSIEWQGQIRVPQPGEYGFGTNSDDASLVFIDDKLVVDNGGDHGDQYAEGHILLDAGWHDFRLRYAQSGGGMRMTLFWTPPGQGREVVPAKVFSYPPRLTLAGGVEPVAQVEVPPPGQVPPATVAAQPGWLVWGRAGDGPGEFREPHGIAVDGQGYVYVADTGNHRVQKFTADGCFVTAWGQQGEGEGHFLEPFSLAVDSQGHILVLDAQTGWIQTFDETGRFLRWWGGSEARFFCPRGMTTDRQDNVYIADTGGKRVIKFSPDGRAVQEFGRPGTAGAALGGPVGIAVDEAGQVYVVDNDHRLILVYGPGGDLLRQWDIPHGGAREGPHLAWGPDGLLYLADPEGNQVLVFRPDGTLVQQWGELGGGPGQLRTPVDIAVDDQGRVYIADTNNHRVQRFTP
jgi:DNA-binding beta-propeller fold protein YncE/4-amino-4-deoxy-L-arabinose transferase-like glycosyltransferase